MSGPIDVDGHGHGDHLEEVDRDLHGKRLRMRNRASVRLALKISVIRCLSFSTRCRALSMSTSWRRGRSPVSARISPSDGSVSFISIYLEDRIGWSLKERLRERDVTGIVRR